MAAPILRTITSLAELRAVAPQWDRLWRESDCESPTLQADLLAVEVEHFWQGRRIRFLVVEQDGQFVAALPLADYVGVPGWRLGSATGNCWSPACDLLVDPRRDLDAMLDLLLSGLCAGHWPIVDFHAIDLAQPRWQAWRRALERRGIPSLERSRLVVGVTRTSADWSQYSSTMSKKHCRQMRRMQKKCDALGGARLRVEREIEPSNIETLVRRGFQIEHASWKGEQYCSVLATTGMLDFYVAQAKVLAARGQLQLTYLELADEAIAFEYGWLSKGVYYAVKIGYDQSRADLTPGQLLRWMLFEQLHAEGCWGAIDFVGPLTRALACWANDQYTVSRLVIAPRRLSGRLALAAYRVVRPLLRREKPCAAATGILEPAVVEGAEDSAPTELAAC